MLITFWLPFQARSYATAVQPPVRLFGIDGRYATALYSAAVKTNALDKVEADLKVRTTPHEAQAVDFSALLDSYVLTDSAVQ